MGEVNQKTQIPLKAMYFFAIIGAVLAFSFELTMLVEMMSIGTLLAYLVVSASVIGECNTLSVYLLSLACSTQQHFRPL